MQIEPNKYNLVSNFKILTQVVSDKDVINTCKIKISGKYIDLYVDKDDENYFQFVIMAEKAYVNLMKIFKQYDVTLKLVNKIKIYISKNIKISHVLGGYNHPKDPQNVIFLNERSYYGAISGVNSTYIHEMVHLLSWNYHSHTLREGLADYFALKLKPDTAIGPVPADLLGVHEQYNDVRRYLGTTKKPPRKLKTDAEFRQKYYYASRYFVRYIVDLYGIDKFMKIYKSTEPALHIQEVFQQKLSKISKNALINI